MEKNGWKSWVISALVAVVLTGVGSTFYSNARADRVEARLKEQILDLEDTQDRTFALVLGMATRLAKVEAHLEDIKKRMDQQDR